MKGGRDTDTRHKENIQEAIEVAYQIMNDENEKAAVRLNASQTVIKASLELVKRDDKHGQNNGDWF